MVHSVWLSEALCGLWSVVVLFVLIAFSLWIFLVLFCLSISVKWLSVKTSEMTHKNSTYSSW